MCAINLGLVLSREPGPDLSPHPPNPHEVGAIVLLGGEHDRYNVDFAIAPHGDLSDDGGC